ncbi:MAG: DUF3732 domain-containing protein [Acidobacteria bacterium]|nr:DUF3732 domain-containing protein [Acidobacteriota bacterium]
MSLQIAKLVLYSREGAVRELALRTGQLNILTGAPQTGKSALIDIIDYVTGRRECNVAEGVIRKYVGWYAVLFQLNGGQVFVARRNPALGERTNPDVYMSRGTSLSVPPATDLVKNTTVPALEKFLTAAVGISENEHRPPAPTRDPLEANFRHSLIFSFQDQNDIDSKKRLFHRQGEDFVNQAIKDTFPYFLGAVDEDRLLKRAQLDEARRQLRRLERELQHAEAMDITTYPRARELVDEAKQVGLVDERTATTSFEGVLEVLQQVARDTRVRDEVVMADGEDLLAGLRTERQGLRSELERVNGEIRSTRMFTTETSGYQREAEEQRARLSAVGLIRTGDHEAGRCPLCESHLPVPVPTAREIERSLEDLSAELEAVEAENPRLQLRLAALLREQSHLGELLRENQQRIAARMRENEILRVQQENFILQARTMGKIQQYVETAKTGDSSTALHEAVEAQRVRAAVLEEELDPEGTREKLSAFLNIIGRYMTEYSGSLNLEHHGSQLRLDIRNLTVLADTLDGAVPLYRMGSGENWVGYHLLAHIALHKWFRLKERPVPGFLILDQPSQAYYPPELDSEGSLHGLADEDQTAVQRLFRLIADAASELAPNLQIIVMDHADLKREWFEEAVVERWRRGKKLLPQSWMV